MAGIPITSAGTKLCYAVETEAGTMPTDVKRIFGCKEIPDFNPAPENLETTSLDNTEYKTYTDGLKDLSSANAYKFNFTKEFVSAWREACEASETAKKQGLATWVYILTPGFDEYCAFTATLTSLGSPGVTVNSVREATVYMTPTGEPAWKTEALTISNDDKTTI